MAAITAIQYSVPGIWFSRCIPILAALDSISNELCRHHVRVQAGEITDDHKTWKLESFRGVSRPSRVRRRYSGCIFQSSDIAVLQAVLNVPISCCGQIDHAVTLSTTMQRESGRCIAISRNTVRYQVITFVFHLHAYASQLRLLFLWLNKVALHDVRNLF